MLLLLLLASVSTSGAEIIPRASYTAAVVEFAPKSSPSDPASLIYSVNLQDFENFTQDVKTQTIRRLSCMARDSSIIVVVNLIERVPCQNCARDDVLLFGLMTCFDIMFMSPAVSLVLDYNVTDIIFPTAWGSELPFLTAVQAQAAWSFSLDVNLLASGYSRPYTYSTGSGIYGGLRHGALKTLMAEVETNEALVATLPPVDSRHSTLQVQICHGDFCCYLTYSVLNSTPDFNYQFLAYDGFRTHADDMYPSKLQVCALIACAFENHTSCAEEIKYSTYSLETEFGYVELYGVFKSQRVWPNTLYADTLNPIQPQDFSYSTEKYGNDYMIRLNSSSVKNGLHTFALYSHDYEPYNPNSTY
ncbi:hypothetical protein B566_EDAN011170 [Ephemera danica]|nr:hypothetical protein B566_EDAN011170 [Ephemera danica]